LLSSAAKTVDVCNDSTIIVASPAAVRQKRRPLKHVSFNMTHFVCFWRVVWQGTARCALRRIGQAV
jgi:hypothetical protein